MFLLSIEILLIIVLMDTFFLGHYNYDFSMFKEMKCIIVVSIFGLSGQCYGSFKVKKFTMFTYFGVYT